MTQKMVNIRWYDARFFSWTYTEDACKAHKMCLFNSMGYLILKNGITTTIAAEYNDEGEYRDITLIPTGSIIEIIELFARTVV